jgi:hypothetical protein
MSELGTMVLSRLSRIARLSNEAEEMQKRWKSTPNGPQHQENVKRHHEKLKFMGLKEKQHLERNYCNLKGGRRPVYKNKIWKQCLIFFLKIGLYSSHETMV